MLFLDHHILYNLVTLFRPCNGTGMGAEPSVSLSLDKQKHSSPYFQAAVLRGQLLSLLMQEPSQGDSEQTEKEPGGVSSVGRRQD